jgi:hypothetical protein
MLINQARLKKKGEAEGKSEKNSLLCPGSGFSRGTSGKKIPIPGGENSVILLTMRLCL